jgi:hypothetical protein
MRAKHDVLQCLRRRSTTTHSSPIGNTTQQTARINPTGKPTRCDRRPTTRKPIATAPGVDPETVQHPVRYTAATTKVTTVENTAFSDGRLNADGE